MLGSPVLMVPTSETGASVVESYLRFEFFFQARDRDIELEILASEKRFAFADIERALYTDYVRVIGN